MQDKNRLRIGKLSNKDEDCYLNIHPSGWARILVIGESRTGKSAFTKDLVVNISKTGRKIVIFSLRGEWENHVTKYSPSRYAKKAKLDNVKVIRDFVIKLSDFSGATDFASLGFSADACEIMDILIKQGMPYFRDDVNKFKELLRDFPTKRMETEGRGKDRVEVDVVQWYKETYGIELMDAAHSETARSLRNNFQYIEEWIWTPEKDDLYVDFAKEFIRNDNLIINIGKDKNKARCLCGIILRKLRWLPHNFKPCFVFEEMWTLLPAIDKNTPDFLLPSSVYEIYDLLTTGSKQGIMFIGICQHEDQIYQPAFEHIYTKIFVGRYIEARHTGSEAYELAKTLMWNPNARGGIGIRECLIYNKNGESAKFFPNDCCCKC